MATKDVKEFNGWFNRSYARLKERLSIYGKIDEDAFHDAYLAVRKQIMFSSVGIEDPESYFFGCYRRILQSGARDESRYDSPGDEYFARLGETDCEEETEEREEMLTGCDRLVRDIQKFLRRHFSYEGLQDIHAAVLRDRKFVPHHSQAHGREDLGGDTQGTGDDGIRPGKPEVHRPKKIDHGRRGGIKDNKCITQNIIDYETDSL